MTAWSKVKTFFNSKRCGKLFTRAEYQKELNIPTSHRNGPNSYDTMALYLVRAGFLAKPEPGVYRKQKIIPKDLSITRCYKLAYPKRSS